MLCGEARTSAAADNLSKGAYLERPIAADHVDADGRALRAATGPAPTSQEQLPLAG